MSMGTVGQANVVSISTLNGTTFKTELNGGFYSQNAQSSTRGKG